MFILMIILTAFLCGMNNIYVHYQESQKLGRYCGGGGFQACWGGLGTHLSDAGHLGPWGWGAAPMSPWAKLKSGPPAGHAHPA